MDTSEFDFKLSLTDFTIILNALHYYKKIEKQPNFAHFTDDMINDLRNRMCRQLSPFGK